MRVDRILCGVNYICRAASLWKRGQHIQTDCRRATSIESIVLPSGAAGKSRSMMS
jgi:hypothetical protein